MLMASLVAQRLKRLLPMRETRLRSLGREDLLEKEMATHSSTLAWKIPQMEKSARLQSMGFSSYEYWNGLPFPSPGDLPEPGIKLRSPTLQADALTSEPPGKPSFFFKGVKMYTHIYSSIICRNQKMETTQTSTDKRTNKQYAVYAYN